MKATFVFVMACLGLFLANLSLNAQASSYRAEFAQGNSGWVELVNTSPQDIIAYELAGECGVGSSSMAVDVLDHPGKAVHPFDRQAHSTAVASEARGLTMFHLTAQSSGCPWQLQVKAVLFADGTYSGDLKDVKRLQARREGIVDAVNYWAARSKETNDAQTWLAGASTDISRMIDEDHSREMYPGCAAMQLLCAYSFGRMQVDGNVQGSLRIDRSAADVRIDFAGRLERWKSMVAADRAFPVTEQLLPRADEISNLPLP